MLKLTQFKMVVNYKIDQLYTPINLIKIIVTNFYLPGEAILILLMCVISTWGLSSITIPSPVFTLKSIDVNGAAT